MRISRFGRRRFVRSSFAALAAGVVSGAISPLRADYYHPPDAQAGGFAPPIVYVSETGHHMEGVFARFWHNAGGASVLGFPITETLIEDGMRTQYFENFRLQYVPAGAGNGELRATPIGRSLLPPGVTIRPTELWPAFAEFYAANSGAVLLGRPLTPPRPDGDRWLQWFENGRLEARRGRDDRTAVWIAPLGTEFAGVSGVNTAPVPPESMATDPNPHNFTRWFETDLGLQTLYFWEAGSVVHETKISSGRIRPTPVGEWRIYRRVQNERMVGGEPGTDGFYDLDNVLYTQYFSPWFDAIHYAYWHNKFGVPSSHGCLNMRFADSWLAWNFATYGTAIETHP